MWLRKDTGGSTIRHRDVDYHWPEDGSVVEVPDELGRALLAIPGSGHALADAPAKPKPAAKAAPAAAAAKSAAGKDDS